MILQFQSGVESATRGVPVEIDGEDSDIEMVEASYTTTSSKSDNNKLFLLNSQNSVFNKSNT